MYIEELWKYIWTMSMKIYFANNITFTSDHFFNTVICNCFRWISKKNVVACITGLKTNEQLREALKIDLDSSSQNLLFTDIISFTKVTWRLQISVY